MFVLDTNVISEMTRPEPDGRVLRWLRETPRDELFLPAVVVAELLAGVELLPPGRKRDGLAGFVSGFVEGTPRENLLAFGLREAPHYAAIVARRRRQGRDISPLDAQIASIAAASGMPVATRNVRDFEECGIAVFNPWEGPTP